MHANNLKSNQQKCQAKKETERACHDPTKITSKPLTQSQQYYCDKPLLLYHAAGKLSTWQAVHCCTTRHTMRQAGDKLRAKIRQRNAPGCRKAKGLPSNKGRPYKNGTRGHFNRQKYLTQKDYDDAWNFYNIFKILHTMRTLD